MRKLRTTMNKSLILVAFIAFTVCSQIPSNGFAEPVYIKFVNKIIEEQKKTSLSEEGLEIIGSGGSFMNDVEKFDLTFISQRCATVNQAREVYVKTYSQMMDRINKDVQIRSYLHEYPYTDKGLDLSIFFKLSESDLNGVEMVTNERGKIYYYRWYPNTLKRQILYEESYQDAVRIVNEKK